MERRCWSIIPRQTRGGTESCSGTESTPVTSGCHFTCEKSPIGFMDRRDAAAANGGEGPEVRASVLRNFRGQLLTENLAVVADIDRQRLVADDDFCDPAGQRIS